VLFELISVRYERRSTLITANQPFGAWDTIFPDPAMTLAAADRLVHHATIFEMHGKLSQEDCPKCEAKAPPRKLIDAPRQSNKKPLSATNLSANITSPRPRIIIQIVALHS
jgi:hypothetical protein